MGLVLVLARTELQSRFAPYNYLCISLYKAALGKQNVSKKVDMYRNETGYHVGRAIHLYTEMVLAALFHGYVSRRDRVDRIYFIFLFLFLKEIEEIIW